jgi:hypothetical protein
VAVVGLIGASLWSAPAGAAVTASLHPAEMQHGAVSRTVLGHAAPAIGAVPLSVANIAVTDFNAGTVTTFTDVPVSLRANCSPNCFDLGVVGELQLSPDAPLEAGNTYTYPDDGAVNVGIGGAFCGEGQPDYRAVFELDQYTHDQGGNPTSFAVQFDCNNADVDISGSIAYNMTNSTPNQGYYIYDKYGDTGNFGNDGYLTYLGNPGFLNLNGPVVGMAPTADANGYWMAAADGGIFTYGDAGFFGSMGGKPLNEPIVGMAATPDGKGYWEVASDGGIFTFGDAGFFGSMGGKPLNEPIVGMAATPDGKGYWEVASDGGIFTFGDARFLGSMGGHPLNRPVVGMAATPDGKGYWEVATDGGIFTFGDAGFFGSTGSLVLNEPIVGMMPTTSGHGYWLVAGDGGVFTFRDAPFLGSAGGQGFTGFVGIVR